MIRRVEIKNYRCLRDVRVDLGDYHAVVGPNGSGKSTFFDAIRFVGDMLNYGLEAAVFGNSKFGLPMRARDPRELTWMKLGGKIEIAVTAELPECVQQRLFKPYSFCTYHCELVMDSKVQLHAESLLLHKALKETPSKAVAQLLQDIAPEDRIDSVRESHARYQDREKPHFPIWDPELAPLLLRHPDFRKTQIFSETEPVVFARTPDSPNRSELSRIMDDEESASASIWFKNLMTKHQDSMALKSEALRLPSPPAGLEQFRSDGSNMPWVVAKLKKNDKSLFGQWLDHVNITLPEIVGIKTYERPEDKHCYLKLKLQSGVELPSWAISDGTLRFLAITLLAYAPETPQITFIEEPENGLHPQCIEALYDSLCSFYDKQVFWATHSPILISVMEPKEILCFSKDDEGAAHVMRGDKHPHLQNWQGRITLGDVFAAGILS